jgi:uncharacterized protein
MRRNYLIAACLLLGTTLNAQIPYVNSGEVITAGVEFYDKGEYKKALEQYRQVNESDTNYALALYEQVITLNADSSFEAAGNLALDALKLPDCDKRRLLLALAASYDYRGKSDSALLVYDSMIVLYPHDHQAWYEKGVIFHNKKDYDKAVDCYQRALILNPGHFLSHYALGLSYTLQGRLTEAFIAYQSSLLMTTNANSAKRIVGLMQSISIGTDEMAGFYKNKDEKYSHPLFDDIDQLVNAKVALSKKYELDMTFKDDAFRQAHLIMEQLKYDARDSNFVMQYYVPLYTDLFKNDNFENCMLLMYSGYGYESIDNMAKKRTKQIGELKTTVFPYFSKIRATRELDYVKRQTAKGLYHYYADNGVLIVGNSVGEGDDLYYTGDVVVYRNDFTLRNRGRENDKGKKVGWWTSYYANGNLSLKDFYVDGVAVDTAWNYYQNGNLNMITIRDKKGTAKAEYEYDVNGWLSVIRKVTGENSVEESSFYSNGQLIVLEKYEDRKLKDGVYKVYYRSGKLKKLVTKKGNVDDGPCKFYYENGRINDSCSYVNGKLEGPYLTFSETGKLLSKYVYKNGKIDGIAEKYYEDGKLKEKDVWKNGKETEIYRYNTAGKLYQTLELDDNILYHIKSYSEDGKVLTDLEDKKGLHKYQLIFDNGNTSVDIMTNSEGQREGKQTYYYGTGAKSDVSEYNDDNLDGVSLTYHRNGRLKSEDFYVNDARDGYHKFYHDNGVLGEEGWYKAGQKQGLWRFYYTNGKLNEEKYFLNDQQDGISRSYNRNAEIQNKFHYSKGTLLSRVCYDTAGVKCDSVFYKTPPASYTLTHWQNKPRFVDNSFSMKHNFLDGPYTTWFINGNIQSQTYYHDQQEDSTNTYYFPDGKVKFKGAYKNGEKTGDWQYYNELGQLTAEDKFTIERNETVTKIYSAGNVRIVYRYINGRKDSAQLYFGAKNKLAFIMYYDDGDFVGYTYAGKDGKMLPQIKVKNGTAKFTTYYADGHKSGEVETEQNLFKNRFVVYYDNDKIAEERTYNGSGVDGFIKRYNQEGKMIYSAEYKDDANIGATETFDDAGNLLISTSFSDDIVHGLTTVVDPATHTPRQYYYHYGVLTSTNK